MINLGEFRLHWLSDGTFKLDGGSMFGVIPKTLWSKRKPADRDNRINLGLNSLLIEGAGKLILVEAGIGDKLDSGAEELYGLRGSSRLIHSLESMGVSVDDVDYLVLSHLHLDHSGWATRRQGSSYGPTFPRARYVVQAREWEAANHPDRRSRPSYDSRNFESLEASGQLELVEGEAQLCEGVWVRLTGGHTPGHQILYVQSRGERCVFLGDLVPTRAHLPVHWHMGWDLFPLELMEVKGKVLEEATRRKDLLFFTHEDTTPFAYLQGNGKLEAVSVNQP